MSAAYDIPMCPGADPGADWQEMGWCCHDCAALAHILWCPGHPGWHEADLMRCGHDEDGTPETDLSRWGETAMLRPFVHDVPGNPETPVPFTLTPKAYAYLALDLSRWAARACGAIVDGALHLETALAGAVVPDEMDAADGWACDLCGDAYFSAWPDDGLCDTCRAKEHAARAPRQGWL